MSLWFAGDTCIPWNAAAILSFIVCCIFVLNHCWWFSIIFEGSYKKMCSLLDGEKLYYLKFLTPRICNFNTIHESFYLQIKAIHSISLKVFTFLYSLWKQINSGSRNPDTILLTVICVPDINRTTMFTSQKIRRCTKNWWIMVCKFCLHTTSRLLKKYMDNFGTLCLNFIMR